MRQKNLFTKIKRPTFFGVYETVRAENQKVINDQHFRAIGRGSFVAEHGRAVHINYAAWTTSTRSNGFSSAAECAFGEEKPKKVANPNGTTKTHAVGRDARRTVHRRDTDRRRACARCSVGRRSRTTTGEGRPVAPSMRRDIYGRCGDKKKIYKNDPKIVRDDFRVICAVIYASFIFTLLRLLLRYRYTRRTCFAAAVCQVDEPFFKYVRCEERIAFLNKTVTTIIIMLLSLL